VNDFKLVSSSRSESKKEGEADDDMASSSSGAASEEIDAYFDVLMEKELRKLARGEDPDMPDEYLDPDIDDDDDDDDHCESMMEEDNDGGHNNNSDDNNEPIPDAHTLDADHSSSSRRNHDNFDDSDDDDEEEAAELEALEEMMMMGKGGAGEPLGKNAQDYTDDEDDDEDDDLFNALAQDSDEDASDLEDYDEDDEKQNERTFAAAEEFAQLLEGNPKMNSAGRKQLEWEAKSMVTSSYTAGKRMNRSNSNNGNYGKKGGRNHDKKIQKMAISSKAKKNKRMLNQTPRKSDSRSTPNSRKKRQKTRR